MASTSAPADQSPPIAVVSRPPSSEAGSVSSTTTSAVLRSKSGRKKGAQHDVAGSETGVAMISALFGKFEEEEEEEVWPDDPVEKAEIFHKKTFDTYHLKHHLMVGEKEQFGGDIDKIVDALKKTFRTFKLSNFRVLNAVKRFFFALRIFTHLARRRAEARNRILVTFVAWWGEREEELRDDYYNHVSTASYRWHHTLQDTIEEFQRTCTPVDVKEKVVRIIYYRHRLAAAKKRRIWDLKYSQAQLKVRKLKDRILLGGAISEAQKAALADARSNVVSVLLQRPELEFGVDKVSIRQLLSVAKEVEEERAKETQKNFLDEWEKERQEEVSTKKAWFAQQAAIREEAYRSRKREEQNREKQLEAQEERRLNKLLGRRTRSRSIAGGDDESEADFSATMRKKKETERSMALEALKFKGGRGGGGGAVAGGTAKFSSVAKQLRSTIHVARTMRSKSSVPSSESASLENTLNMTWGSSKFAATAVSMSDMREGSPVGMSGILTGSETMGPLEQEPQAEPSLIDKKTELIDQQQQAEMQSYMKLKLREQRQNRSFRKQQQQGDDEEEEPEPPLDAPHDVWDAYYDRKAKKEQRKRLQEEEQLVIQKLKEERRAIPTPELQPFHVLHRPSRHGGNLGGGGGAVTPVSPSVEGTAREDFPLSASPIAMSPVVASPTTAMELVVSEPPPRVYQPLGPTIRIIDRSKPKDLQSFSRPVSALSRASRQSAVSAMSMNEVGGKPSQQTLVATTPVPGIGTHSVPSAGDKRATELLLSEKRAQIRLTTAPENVSLGDYRRHRSKQSPRHPVKGVGPGLTEPAFIKKELLRPRRLQEVLSFAERRGKAEANIAPAGVEESTTKTVEKKRSRAALQQRRPPTPTVGSKEGQIHPSFLSNNMKRKARAAFTALMDRLPQKQ